MTRKFSLLMALCMLLAPACGSKSDKKANAKSGTSGQMSKRADNPAFSFNDSTGTSIDSRARVKVLEKDMPNLMSLLPARIGRYKKIYEKSERYGPEVMLLYSAWAEYNTPDGEAVILHITDTGYTPELQKSMAEWAKKPIEIKNERGYERSITFEGYPGFQKEYGKESSELAVWVADRYIVNAACFNCPLDVLREAIRAVPLKKLEVLQ